MPACLHAYLATCCRELGARAASPPQASKYRMTDKYSVDLQRIVKIQSLGRARLARTSTKMLKTSKALG